MPTETNIAVTGATGRMGRRLIALSHGSPLKLVAALAAPGSAKLGQDSGELAGVGRNAIPVSDTLDPNVRVDVMIDFSTPAGFREWLEVCGRRRINLLVGTTGLNEADQRAIDAAGLSIAVLHATNTSLGVAVLNHVSALMARMLDDSYDIEIIESHHKHKKDAPSGTAVTLADRVLAARQLARDALQHGRVGGEALREHGTVGMHSLRMGDVVGDHTVHFATDGERLSITHQATSRDTFAKGALKAANWLAGKQAGRYRIEDVLGIQS